MSRFECYFDGSYTPNVSGCAFCVMSNGEMLHSQSCHERFQSSYLAEMRALYILLQYIQNEIEPGSAIEVFGDAKGLIDKLMASKSRRSRSKTQRLFNRLRGEYDISLRYIPRKMNKVAHKLARAECIPSPEMRGIGHVQGPGYTLAGQKTMLLKDIIIPNYIVHGRPPGQGKYQKRLHFYQSHGRVFRTIRVNTDGVLLDGYISYLILKEHGIDECLVNIMSGRDKATD